MRHIIAQPTPTTLAHRPQSARAARKLAPGSDGGLERCGWMARYAGGGICVGRPPPSAYSFEQWSVVGTMPRIFARDFLASVIFRDSSSHVDRAYAGLSTTASHFTLKFKNAPGSSDQTASSCRHRPMSSDDASSCWIKSPLLSSM